MTNRTMRGGGSPAVADAARARAGRRQVTATRRSNEWTMTPLQAMLGPRVGFRRHWKYWATGLSGAFVVGTFSGIKIGHQAWRQRRRDSSAHPG